MQSTLSQIPTNSFQLQFSWKSHKQQFQSNLFNNFNLNNKTLFISSSLTNSYEEIDSGDRPLRLPIVIRKDGKVSQYIWNGSHVELECIDGNGNTSNWVGTDDWFDRLYQFCSTAVQNFLIPQHVHSELNYKEYVKWKFVSRVFSSALQVLATQAMFRAMGVGFSRSLPSAAALNWVLKDGLGRLSRFIYTASLASTFDTKLKRIRFSTSIVFSLSIGVELLTPFFPHYFLLIATVANIGKQLSLACYLATNNLCEINTYFNINHDIMPRFRGLDPNFIWSAVHRSFAVADNLCELSAKSQIQTVCFDNLGLMLAALLSMLCKNNQSLQAALALAVYPIFSAIDLFGIYQGLKHVHLQTLTKDRLEVILDTWIQSKIVPSPEEVSKEEGIDLPWCKGSRQWPIRIGCFDEKDTIPKFSMLTMQLLRNEDSYFICLETTNRGFARRLQGGILLSLRDGAGINVGSTKGTPPVTTDVIMGLLQASFIRREVLLSFKKWELILEADNISESVLKEWFQLVEDSKRYAESEVKLMDKENILLSEQRKAQPLEKKIEEAGWAVNNILLNDQEKICYSFLDVTKKRT